MNIKTKYGPLSLFKHTAIVILALMASDHPATITELSQTTGQNQETVRKHLYTLMEYGAVSKLYKRSGYILTDRAAWLPSMKPELSRGYPQIKSEIADNPRILADNPRILAPTTTNILIDSYYSNNIEEVEEINAENPLFKLLASYKIGEPARSQILARPGITEEFIKSTIADLRKRNKGNQTGLIIHCLKSNPIDVETTNEDEDNKYIGGIYAAFIEH